MLFLFARYLVNVSNMKSSLFRLSIYAWRNKQGIPSQYAVGNVVLPKNNTSFYFAQVHVVCFLWRKFYLKPDSLYMKR